MLTNPNNTLFTTQGFKDMLTQFINKTVDISRDVIPDLATREEKKVELRNSFNKILQEMTKQELQEILVFEFYTTIMYGWIEEQGIKLQVIED